MQFQLEGGELKREDAKLIVSTAPRITKGGREMKRKSHEVLLKGILAAFFVLLTALGAQAVEKELVVHDWGGRELEAHKAAFYEPFTAETGIKVIPSVAGGDFMGKVASQVRSNKVEWDVVGGFGIDVVEGMAKKGLLEPINYKIVTNTKDLIAGAVTKYGVGVVLGAFCVTYNTKVFTGEKIPNSWADFYDPNKFPGPRANHNWGGPVYHYFSALIADGVPRDKLVPIDYDRAFKVLDRIKPHVKVWYSTGDRVMQALMDKEVVLAHTTEGRAMSAMQLGAETTIVANEALTGLWYSCVVKGAPHKEAAMKFMTFRLRPDLQAIYTNYMNTSGSNPKSLMYIPPKDQKKYLLHPDNFKKTISLFTAKEIEWLGDHQSEMFEKWNAWISK
jgi:putative spermidine/putrescine transport system substrate-binding protein/mannopine transport system substrate-binding protein